MSTEATEKKVEAKFFAVSEQVLIATLEYLAKRPMNEVEQLVGILRQSQQLQAPEVGDKPAPKKPAPKKVK